MPSNAAQSNQTGTPRADLLLSMGLAFALFLVSSCHVGYEFIYGFGGHKVLTAIGESLAWDSAISRAAARYVAAQLLVHGLFGLLVFLLAQATRAAFSKAAMNSRERVGAWFLISSVWVLIANAGLYPHTALGVVFAAPLEPGLFGFKSLTIATAIYLVLAITVAAWAAFRSRSARKWSVVALSACAAAGAITAVPNGHSAHSKNADTARPHIVLIGIDSLHGDFLDDPRRAALAPNLAKFVSSAAQFSDTITPLARTYPAWVSVLTGRHPHTTGATVNLIPKQYLKLGKTLPQVLREVGYSTFYAIDETRFSNVDETYGFDRAVYPPMGVADFALGEINDLPLSNLLINTSIGGYLFPNAHANRGAATTYDPDTFLERIDSAVGFEKPTLMAVHLTLVHWPYMWADSKSYEKGATGRDMYEQTVARVDQQFGDLMAILERRGVLKNAIVIVFSDHGEGLRGDSKSLVSEQVQLDGPPIPVAHAGHGTSVLVPDQYQTLLSVRRFGNAESLLVGESAAPASLEDIAPTIVELLQLVPSEHSDGMSLVPLLKGIAQEQKWESRIRFTESESNLAPIVAGDETLRKEQLERAAIGYRVDDETGRIYIRDDRVRQTLIEREYAAVQGHNLLAALPTFDERRFEYVWVDRDLPRVERVNLESRPSDPVFETLWDALHARFRSLESSTPDPTLSAQQRHSLTQNDNVR